MTLNFSPQCFWLAHSQLSASYAVALKLARQQECIEKQRREKEREKGSELRLGESEELKRERVGQEEG